MKTFLLMIALSPVMPHTPLYWAQQPALEPLPANTSAPYCPRQEIDAADPERYYEHIYHYGPAAAPQTCVELIDKQQTAPNGGKCKVQMSCGT